MYECPGGAVLSAAAPGSAASADFPDSVPARPAGTAGRALSAVQGLYGQNPQKIPGKISVFTRSGSPLFFSLSRIVKINFFAPL